MRASLLLLACLAAPGPAAAQITIAPYVQARSATDVSIKWVDTRTSSGVLEWGPTAALGRSKAGTIFRRHSSLVFSEARLTGLTPGTRYHYRVRSGTYASPVRDFKTWPPRPAAGQDATFRVVLVGDMQKNPKEQARGNPMWRRVVKDGIEKVLRDRHGPRLSDGAHLVLSVGDNVEQGNAFAQWDEEFFAPAETLFAHVPVTSIRGNHEGVSDYYNWLLAEDDWQLFVPEVGLLILSADTNRETEWSLARFLTGLFIGWAHGSAVDFMLAAGHHNVPTESWGGYSRFAVLLAELLSLVSESRGYPTGYLFGHVHAFEHRVHAERRTFMLDVASAGGAIDYPSSTKTNLPRTLISRPEYGFGLLEVKKSDAGANLCYEHFSLGDDNAPHAVRLVHTFALRRDNARPARPAIVTPRGQVTAIADLVGSGFQDPDRGELHGGTQWEIARDRAFGNVVFSDLAYFKDEYRKRDLAPKDLTRAPLPALQRGVVHWVRVRYRDRNLSWSDWSEPASFSVR